MKRARGGKKWFYAQGQRVKSSGLNYGLSHLWASRNDIPYWAWMSFCNGFDGRDINYRYEKKKKPKIETEDPVEMNQASKDALDRARRMMNMERMSRLRCADVNR